MTVLWALVMRAMASTRSDLVAVAGMATGMTPTWFPSSGADSWDLPETGTEMTNVSACSPCADRWAHKAEATAARTAALTLAP